MLGHQEKAGSGSRVRRGDSGVLGLSPSRILFSCLSCYAQRPSEDSSSPCPHSTSPSSALVLRAIFFTTKLLVSYRPLDKKLVHADYTGGLPARATRGPPQRQASPSLARPASKTRWPPCARRAWPVTQVASLRVHQRAGARVVAAPQAYARRRPRSACSASTPSTRSRRRERERESHHMTPTSTRRPRDCSANVKREADHIEIVAHVLRFAYFLPAGPPARETCKNSRRRDERRQRSQIVIRASAHGNKSTRRVEVVSGARELDRVVGEGRPGLASSSGGSRKRRGGRGGHSCGSARAMTDVS